MRHYRQAVRAGNQSYRVLRHQSISWDIGITAVADILVECLADALHVARLQQRLRDMRASHRPLRNFAHTLPLDVNTLLVQKLHYALPASLARVTQHLQNSLESRPLELWKITKHMHLTPAHIGIDLNTRDKVDIQF